MEKIIFNIDPYTFTGSAFLIGLLLVQELSPNEQNSIANWLQLVGLTIQTYTSQVTVVKSSNENEHTNDIETLKKTVQTIQDQLNKL